MLKTLLPYAKKYKLFAILTPLFIVGEVLLETRIPLLMSDIVDIGIPDKNVEPEFNQVFRANSQNGKCRGKRKKLNKTMRKLSDKSKSGAF